MKKLIVIALAAFATFTLSAQTLGKVNFNELVMLMPEMDTAREAINASQKEAEETYSAMVEEYQGKMNQYQQKQASWTAAIRESKERELMEIQNRIQEFQQSISQELQQQQNQLTAPIQEKAAKAVNEIAKAKGLTRHYCRCPQSPEHPRGPHPGKPPGRAPGTGPGRSSCSGQVGQSF